MKLIVGTMLLAVLIGLLAGGKVSNLSNLQIRWAPLALAGLILQVVLPPGDWPLVLLLVSFLILCVFAVKNIGMAGFPLILIGIALNFTVIAVNHGMPVTQHALAASGQQATLQGLVEHGGAKHHLAGASDHLLFLGDVIAIPPPIGQAISVGDVFTYAGVAWFLIAGVRGRGGSVFMQRRRHAPGPMQEAGGAGS